MKYILVVLSLALSFQTYDYLKYIKEHNYDLMYAYFEMLNEAETGYFLACNEETHDERYCRQKAAAYVVKVYEKYK